jgi:alpha-L-fucosidase
MKRIVSLLFLAAIFWVTAASAMPQGGQRYTLKYGAQRTGPRQDEAMKRFRSNRLGAFIHWGLYAIPGGEWNGKVYSGAAEWLKVWAGVSTADWMKLMDRWNPTQFDAHRWARTLREAGFRYVKITTKHHEGFCLWPTRTTRYNVAHTPYKKDILGELVKALGDEGLDVHFYFSVMDWSNPDYRSSLKTADDSAAWTRFKKFTESQLHELGTRYPTVRDFWFDGTWDASIKGDGAWTLRLENLLKQWRPGVTVNSRLRADDRGSRHFDSNGNLMGDYESGYERRLPDPVKDLKVTQWDWEACMTLPENQWGYHKDWSLSYVKTPVEVLENIVHAVSMGGNMVVNFGPDANGCFRPEEERLAAWLGRWLSTGGEAVYGCGYAGWPKADWGYYTRRADTVYMVVFNQPLSGLLHVKTPAGTTVKAACLTDGTPLKVTLTTKNEYNIQAAFATEPYVVRLTTAAGQGNGNFRDALT